MQSGTATEQPSSQPLHRLALASLSLRQARVHQFIYIVPMLSDFIIYDSAVPDIQCFYGRLMHAFKFFAAALFNCLEYHLNPYLGSLHILY